MTPPPGGQDGDMGSIARRPPNEFRGGSGCRQYDVAGCERINLRARKTTGAAQVFSAPALVAGTTRGGVNSALAVVLAAVLIAASLFAIGFLIYSRGRKK